MSISSSTHAPGSQRDYVEIRNDIKAILDRPGYDDDSIGPVLVRLAWHSSGTYDAKTKTGGSDGAGMRYEKEGGDAANAGLSVSPCRLERTLSGFFPVSGSTKMLTRRNPCTACPHFPRAHKSQAPLDLLRRVSLAALCSLPAVPRAKCSLSPLRRCCFSFHAVCGPSLESSPLRPWVAPLSTGRPVEPTLTTIRE